MAASIYNNNQNVHKTSIQTGVEEAINFIIVYKADVQVKNLPQAIYKEWKKLLTGNIFKKIKKKTYLRFIRSDLEDHCYGKSSLDTFGGIYFIQVLKGVYLYTMDHPNKTEIFKRLLQECGESYKKCNVGRFSRTVNALVGFCDEIQIGISSGEQLQARVAIAVKNNRKLFKDCDTDLQAYEEFKEKSLNDIAVILDELQITDISKRQAWLQSL